jgi:hypothetical protein
MALKLDFGCGNTPREGFLGVDITTVGTKADIAVDLLKPSGSAIFLSTFLAVFAVHSWKKLGAFCPQAAP